MSTYQLLPNHRKDELDGLTASIREHGVEVPVLVDEVGEIIDGHTRVMIADSLGIDYPTVTREGLSEAEKRILAAELNVARRELSDVQRVFLGRDLEPAIRERAEERMKAGKKADPVDTCPQGREKSRDEIARIVGLGSGRTYERCANVIDELAAEEDGDALLNHLRTGDWDFSDARQELNGREQDRARKRAHDEWERRRQEAEAARADEPEEPEDEDGPEDDVAEEEVAPHTATANYQVGPSTETELAYDPIEVIGLEVIVGDLVERYTHDGALRIADEIYRTVNAAKAS